MIESFSEIRHLPQQVVSELGRILQLNEHWKNLMALIPGKPWIPGNSIEGMDYSRKYSFEDIRLVADECTRAGRTGLEILIEEWGTSGRVRPKVNDLIWLAYKAGLERAASYLESVSEVPAAAQSGCPPDPSPSDGTAALSPSDGTAAPSLSEGTGEEDLFSEIPCVPYEEVMMSITPENKIGDGGFGCVYKVPLCIREQAKIYAIKFLSDPDEFSTQQFRNEMDILARCLHKNIISLEGYCRNQSDLKLGLICEFMENGSLCDRLVLRDNSAPLPWRLRCSISVGTAEGIAYLHTNFSPPLVHRDIKSPNILLDRQFNPKLGDFGIARLGSRGLNTASVQQTTMVGTCMYMAPEAMRGDVSVKGDTYSFGVVILEILTGLPVFDETREDRDLLTFVQNYEGDRMDLLDPLAEWEEDVGERLFDFSENCFKRKNRRPHMVQVLEMLRSIFERIS